MAWSVGVNTGRLAGVIGVGGRLVDEVPPGKFWFAHYGFAGVGHSTLIIHDAAIANQFYQQFAARYDMPFVS